MLLGHLTDPVALFLRPLLPDVTRFLSVSSSQPLRILLFSHPTHLSLLCFAESLMLMQQAAATAGQLFLLSPGQQEFSETFAHLTSQVS